MRSPSRNASGRRCARSRSPLARWTRTLGLATLVGWLGGVAALALAGALHAAIPLLIGNFARPGASAMLDLRWEILFLPALGALVSGLVVRAVLGALFQERGLEALPVVEDRASGHFVGMLTRSLVYETLRGHLERMRQSLLREHAGIAAIEEQSELVHLLGAMSSVETGSVERVPVGPELAGRSLREIDYRRSRGAQVLAIQTSERRFLCPPDPGRPLAEGDVLLVLGA